MRSLKFRAWDKEDKKYLLPENQEFVILPTRPSFGVTIPFQSESYPNENLDIDCVDWADADLIMGRYELEQYTGLKDKNGKEIYEGDIVTETYPLNYTQPESPDNIEVIDYWVVKWEEKRAGFAPFCNCDTNGEYLYEVHVPDIVEVKVAGNIHENPEILEEKNE